MSVVYFGPTDPLDLADASDIVLNSANGGPRMQYVEVFSPTGAYLAGGTVAIRPREEYSIEYTLVGGSLVLNIGALVNTNYVITGVNVSCRTDGYPTVGLTALKFTNANMFNATNSLKTTLTITGGLGVVNLFGATAAGAISSSMSLSAQTAETLAPTGGDLAVGGFVMYGLKQECQLESTSAITLPAGGKLTSEDSRKSSTGAQINFKAWFEYLTAPTPP
ncbi:MAG: hypothetical protein KBC05_14875 [Candidatus Hydrogenedentes bacterium]|nr:hypothetical protein [Candidatus Hydrogenedentota bacterium]